MKELKKTETELWNYLVKKLWSKGIRDKNILAKQIFNYVIRWKETK